jgi:hypothetical protein
VGNLAAAYVIPAEAGIYSSQWARAARLRGHDVGKNKIAIANLNQGESSSS